MNTNNNFNFPLQRKRTLPSKRVNLPDIEEFSTENLNVSTFQINAINEKNYKLSHILDTDKNHFSNVDSGNAKCHSVLSAAKTNRPKTPPSPQKAKIMGKIFFYDCSNGTSCLYVGDFESPNCVSTANALIVGIGGFYQEFVNDSTHQNEPFLLNQKLNLKKIFQFSYSPRLRGAFVSEEEFDQGNRKSSRTLYHNGILLQIFFTEKYVPAELTRFLQKQEMFNLDYKTKSSEAEADSEEGSENYGYVSFPFEKQLISIFGIVKGNEKQFVIKGKALFNHSLEISTAELSFGVSRNQVSIKIPDYDKTIHSIESFFTQIQISKMKLLLEKPDESKISGYHIYKGSGQQKLQGFFLNDHLIVHKDQIDECKNANFDQRMSSPGSGQPDCLNCQGKSADHLVARNISVPRLVELIKSKLCKGCAGKLFEPSSLNSSSSVSSNENKYAKKSICFPVQRSDIDPNSNPNKKKLNAKMEKITFPYESPFSLKEKGYGLAEYEEDNHKIGPVHTPNFFKGEIKHGKKQGFIYENFENEECYAGFYKNGFRQGFGQLYKYGKYFFEGKFRKNRKHGPGKIWFVNGEFFDCYFKNNSIERKTPNQKLRSDKTKTEKKKMPKPSISPSKSKHNYKSPRRSRISRNQKGKPISTNKGLPKVEFSVLQANSKAMNKKKKRGHRPLGLFKHKLEKEKCSNLNDWITMTQQKIHSKRESASPRWTKQHKELFDDKSDLEFSDIDKSHRSKIQGSILRSGYSKSPKKIHRTVFLFEDKDSLNFDRKSEVKRRTSIFN